MSELVERLLIGQHPVEISLRPDQTIDALRERIERGFVHVRFTETRGGTELGIPIDRQRSDLSAADFAGRTGQLTIVGDLTFDYIRVRCIAEIDLPSLQGRGRLERLPQTAISAS